MSGGGVPVVPTGHLPPLFCVCTGPLAAESATEEYQYGFTEKL